MIKKSKTEREMDDIKKKWVAALRSGEYDQGQIYLCQITPDGAKYCALGVLYEVMHGEGGWWKQPGSYTCLLTHQGYGAAFGGGYFDHLTYEIIEMNDRGDTFDEIADWLEGI